MNLYVIIYPSYIHFSEVGQENEDKRYLFTSYNVCLDCMQAYFDNFRVYTEHKTCQ